MPLNRGMRSRTSGRVPTSITISPAPLSIGSGTSQLTAVVKDQTGIAMAGTQPDAWHSSDNSVVTVGVTGLVTFVNLGVANVTASLATGGGTITSNTCVVSATTGVNYSKHNFNDGTLGPFSHFAAGIDVIDDPTGSGRGKVCRMHYQTFPPGNVDSNIDIYPTNFAFNQGAEFWFTGDFYLDPATCRMDSGVQRKLLYWGWDGLGVKGDPYTFVVSSFGVDLYMAPHPHINPMYPVTVGSVIASGVWYTLKMHIKIQSNFSALDGICECWFNNVLKFQDLAFNMAADAAHPASDGLDPTWANMTPADYIWSAWGVGTQADSSVAIDEYRYWDNLSWASTEGAL